MPSLCKWRPPRNALLPFSRWEALIQRGDDPLLPRGARLIAVGDQSDSRTTQSYDLRTQPAFLLGRDTSSCDIALSHPSSSGQHAVLFFCAVADVLHPRPAEGAAWNSEIPDDLAGDDIDLFLQDLGSTHGTTLNNSLVRSWENIRLRDRDVLTFGLSTKSYVVVMPL